MQRVDFLIKPRNVWKKTLGGRIRIDDIIFVVIQRKSIKEYTSFVAGEAWIRFNNSLKGKPKPEFTPAGFIRATPTQWEDFSRWLVWRAKDQCKDT